jgi:tetratricopeptide (TPR) repeat protein
VDNLANDSGEIRSSMSDLTTQMNRLIQLLTDMSNAIKVMQAPAAAPPSSKFYPDDPFAANAQYYIGQIHYSQKKYDLAKTDFDAVLERYPESKVTPDAYFMKGMALKTLARRDAAAEQFRAVVRQYPHSDRAPEALEQLRAMGLTAAGPVGAANKKTKK